MLAHELIGKVAAERIGRLLDAPPPSRMLYGVLGLAPEVTCAIAKEVASLTISGWRVDACVHPDLKCADIGQARVSDATATYHRNHADPDVLLTLFSVPARDIKWVEQSLSHVEHIDDEWLLEELAPWALHGMPDADMEMRQHLETVLKGLVRSRAAFDTRRVADYVVRLARHVQKDGLTLANAARRALPALRLPRDAGDTRAKLLQVSEVEQFFRKVLEDVRPALHLQGRDGEPLVRSDLQKRLDDLKQDGPVRRRRRRSPGRRPSVCSPITAAS